MSAQSQLQGEGEGEGEGKGQGDSELEGLLAVAQQRIANRPVIAKISYSHEAMIDLIIANPGISQNAIAAHFGYTASWISQVISSDTFQTALAKRREQLVDPVIAAEVETQFKSLVSRSLDILHQKLNRPAMEIPDNLALRTLEIASRAAGYGAKDIGAQPATTPVEVNIHLEQLGGGLVQLLRKHKRDAAIIDAQPVGGANQGAAPMLDSSPAQAASLIADLTNDSQED